MKILIVCGEYPPRKGGIGRYTSNLVNALKNNPGLEIIVACDKSNQSKQENIYKIISPGSQDNSAEILKIVRNVRPDIVHVQYEPSLYETHQQSLFKKFRSTLGTFYALCDVPTISTLHSIFPLDEYLEFINKTIWRKEGRLSFLPLMLRALARKRTVKKHYNELLKTTELPDEIINLSTTSHRIVGRGKVIYLGAEPAFILDGKSKQQLRKELHLPENKILLVFGHAYSSKDDTAKGFDILGKLNLPRDWSIVMKQTSRDKNTEEFVCVSNVVDLGSGYIDEHDVSKLFFACDAMLIPRRFAGSTSGVLFDALAHGMPFVASNLRLFREFEEMNLGITSEIEVDAIANAVKKLALNYETLRNNVEKFAHELHWDVIASKHLQAYNDLISRFKGSY